MPTTHKLRPTGFEGPSGHFPPKTEKSSSGQGLHLLRPQVRFILDKPGTCELSTRPAAGDGPAATAGSRCFVGDGDREAECRQLGYPLPGRRGVCFPNIS